MFPRNVPKRSLRMFPECSHEKFYEPSIQMLSERSYGRFQERSLWIFSEYCWGTFSQYSFWTFLERSTETFREHCFGTFKKPGHFLSSRNVPMEPSEHSTGTFIERSGKVLCYGGKHQTNTQFLHHVSRYQQKINFDLRDRCRSPQEQLSPLHNGLSATVYSIHTIQSLLRYAIVSD